MSYIINQNYLSPPPLLLLLLVLLVLLLLLLSSSSSSSSSSSTSSSSPFPSFLFWLCLQHIEFPRPGIEPATLWILVRFISLAPHLAISEQVLHSLIVSWIERGQPHGEFPLRHSGNESN